MPAEPNNTHVNSIMALRTRELAKQLRPFRARGSKVIRCQVCLLPAVHCLCSERPAPSSKSAFCFLMYHGEAFKPSNTGRLIADVAPDNHAFLWNRTQPDPALLQLLTNPRYSPIVIFPSEYASAQRCIRLPSEAAGVQDGRIPLFVMLDGTWREARKMFNSPYLQKLPVLGITDLTASAYRLRESAHAYQLCTVEVGVALLKLSDEPAAAESLQNYFYAFRRLYTAGKPDLLKRFREQDQSGSGA